MTIDSSEIEVEPYEEMVGNVAFRWPLSSRSVSPTNDKEGFTDGHPLQELLISICLVTPHPAVRPENSSRCDRQPARAATGSGSDRLPLGQISFLSRPSVAELAPWRIMAYSLTHPAYSMHWEPKLALRTTRWMQFLLNDGITAAVIQWRLKILVYKSWINGNKAMLNYDCRA